MREQTPIWSIRKRCLDCAGAAQEVSTCKAKECSLWDYRDGHRPKGRVARLTPVKAMRAHCLIVHRPYPTAI